MARHTRTPTPHPETNPLTVDETTSTTPAEATSELEREMLAILSNHCGERGTSEGAVETLSRIIAERDTLFPIRHAGHTRALLVTHVPKEGETYDKGRKYEVRLLDAQDGKVEVHEVAEVAEGEKSLGMPFHVAESHLVRHFSDFLKPGQFR
jgi:hypothetical protein